MFPGHKYLSMENLDIRDLAADDPRGILDDYGKNIILEFYKRSYHVGEKPLLFFWRDKAGNEVALIVDIGLDLLPIEIKSSKTYSSSMKSSLVSWLKLKGNESERGLVVYRGGDVIGKKSSITITPWWLL